MRHGGTFRSDLHGTRPVSVASADSGLRGDLKSWQAEPRLLLLKDTVLFAVTLLLGKTEGALTEVLAGEAWRRPASGASIASGARGLLHSPLQLSVLGGGPYQENGRVCSAARPCPRPPAHTGPRGPEEAAAG